MNDLSTLVGSVVTALVMGLGLSPLEAERRVRVQANTRGDGTGYARAEFLEEDYCCSEHEYSTLRTWGETPEAACADLLEQVLEEVRVREEDLRFNALNPSRFEVEGRLSSRNAKNAVQMIGLDVRGDKLRSSRSARRASKDVLRYELSTYGESF